VRLAIVGSVSFRNQEVFDEACSLAWDYLVDPLNYIDLFISGGADGMDKLAESFADRLNIPKRIYLPENKRWAPNGFKDRNLKIATDCTHLLCIRDKTSKTYGSGWTSDRAKEMGKVVWRYDL